MSATVGCVLLSLPQATTEMGLLGGLPVSADPFLSSPDSHRHKLFQLIRQAFQEC